MRPQPIDPDIDAWEAWDPPTVARLLDGVRTRWDVVAGWALDLFCGQQTRAHEDLEIAVPEQGFDEIRERLSGYDFYVPGEGKFWPLDVAGDHFFVSHQTWVREPNGGKWRLDVMRDPHEGDTWICRRNRNIRRPYDDLIAHSAEGIPYMRPEYVLLFKAKHMREKDEADLEAFGPRLDDHAREWLEGAIAETYGDDHPWVERVRATRAGGAGRP